MSYRRRFRRHGKGGAISEGAKTNAERRVLAFYLYQMSLLEIDDDDIMEKSIVAILKLSEKLGKKEKLNDFLLKIVSTLVVEGRLTPLSTEEKDNEICFDYSSVPYAYEEDKRVDRHIPSGLRNIDEIIVNFFRVAVISNDENLLPEIIANFLVRKNPANDMRLLDSIPAYVQSVLEKNTEVEFVSNSVGLSENETRLLTLYARLYSNQLFSELYNDFTRDLRHRINQKILGLSPHNYSALIRADSKLRAFGFLDDEGFIQDDFLECIEAQNMKPFFADLLKELTGTPYPLDSFNVNADTTKIMRKMLSSSEAVSLMLYGKPGSGKTEYARALALESGQKAYIFKNERELAHSDNDVLCRLNCLLSFSQKDSVIVIDEADTLLRTRDTIFGFLSPNNSKGIVNKMLEENNNKTIWIVNFTSQIDESTLRRFTYSYKFEAMPKSQLRAIAESKLAPLSLDSQTNTQILDLMERYSVTGSSVDNVVKTIKCLSNSEENEKSPDSPNSPDSLVQCVQSVLKENELLINGKSQMRESVTSSYDLTALNASMPPEQIVRMIENAKSFAEKNLTAQNTGIRMLFYGLSGTGKTEFARYIAQKLGKKILLKRASDILGMYVGETEKNIRDAFEEASRAESILLFDEADSFFADRKDAEHSWERTRVNEFLTQMEEFSGILICTTNLKEIMDSAMNRRFHLIVEFKPLTKEGIYCMAEKYFPSIQFSDKDFSRLENRKSITPGDFGVLQSRVRFMDQNIISSSYLTDELLKMQDEKEGGSHTIGFFGA